MTQQTILPSCWASWRAERTTASKARTSATKKEPRTMEPKEVVTAVRKDF